ncbi:hypothetical protein BROUX41_005435 [Berkeleyomyces rouxiae]
MSFAEYANSSTEPESQLRANMELLQSLAQGAQPDDQSTASQQQQPSQQPSQQAPQQPSSNPSLSNIAAQASRAAALAANDRRDDGPAGPETGSSFLHPHLRSPEAVQPQLTAAAASSIPVSVVVPVSVAEPPMIPSGMPIPATTAQMMPMQAALTSPTGIPMDMSVEMDEGGVDSDLSHSIDGRHRAKRELSTTKRAAQNRAAQRAFRQRKENHIRKLEVENANYALMEKRWKEIEAENHSLREYCVHIQRRLLDLQGKCPPPPVPLTGDQSGASVGSSAASAADAASSGAVLQDASRAAQMAADVQARAQSQLAPPPEPSSAGEPMATDVADPAPNAPSLDQVAQAVAGLAAAGRQSASQSPAVA